LPKNISNYSYIEGIYSNISINKREIRLWQLVDHRHEIKSDSINVKVEIVNPKTLKFTFLRSNEKIGEKLVKGGFQAEKCFYTRRRFYVIPILPVLWMFSNEQERIYHVDDELIIETTSNSGGAVIIMAGGNKYNDIWRFKRLKN
jgi:hypothetical protein